MSFGFLDYISGFTLSSNLLPLIGLFVVISSDVCVLSVCKIPKALNLFIGGNGEEKVTLVLGHVCLNRPFPLDLHLTRSSTHMATENRHENYSVFKIEPVTPDKKRRVPLGDISLPIGQTPITHQGIRNDPLGSTFPATFSSNFDDYKLEATLTAPKKIDIEHPLSHKERNLVSPPFFPTESTDLCDLTKRLEDRLRTLENQIGDLVNNITDLAKEKEQRDAEVAEVADYIAAMKKEKERQDAEVADCIAVLKKEKKRQDAEVADYIAVLKKEKERQDAEAADQKKEKEQRDAEEYRRATLLAEWETCTRLINGEPPFLFFFPYLRKHFALPALSVVLQDAIGLQGPEVQCLRNWYRRSLTFSEVYDADRKFISSFTQCLPYLLHGI